MVSTHDLGYSNYSTTQATSGNLIATSSQCLKCLKCQKVGYFKKLYKFSTFSVKGLLCEVAIGLPEVAWVVLWLEQPRSSAETLRSQNLWPECSKSSSYVLFLANMLYEMMTLMTLMNFLSFPAIDFDFIWSRH